MSDNKLKHHVTIEGKGFAVSRDEQRILADFLETALSPQFPAENTAKRLDAGQEGFVVAGLSGAIPVRDLSEDWPHPAEFKDFAFIREPWLVWSESPGEPARRTWIDGDALRELFAQARALRRT